MEVRRESLEQMLDQVADYASDWDEILQMVAVVDNTGERPLLQNYLELLLPRLKQMDRKFNRVEKLVLPEGNCWRIRNYSYDVYKYFVTQYPEVAICTPMTLTLMENKLKQKDNDFLRTKLENK